MTGIKTKTKTALDKTRANNAKRSELFKKVETVADVPGVGKIPITLIEVEFGGQVHRANTRKECQQWLTAQRKAVHDKARAENEAERTKKAEERYAKMAPAVTDRLEAISEKLRKLSENETVESNEEPLLLEAAALITQVAVLRRQ